MKEWKSVKHHLLNTNQQKTQNCLDHPFLTLLRSSIKVGKWRSDSLRGEQTHLKKGKTSHLHHFFSKGQRASPT